MKKVLVVYCSMTGNTKAAAEAIASGVVAAGGQVSLKDCKEATAEDLLQCGAVAFGSYDAFSYMGGGLKDYFDRIFYPAKDSVAGKPFAAFMTHGGKGNGIASIEALAQAMKLKKLADSIPVPGRPDDKALGELKSLGGKLVEACSK